MTAHARDTVRFGLNYTPGTSWYYIWNDWDEREIVGDLAAVGRLGADHIRVQLIWPSFQPNPGFVSKGHLKRLAQLVDIAGANGLDVQLSLLTGFLSGWTFLPPFVLNHRAIFSDPAVFDAEVLFAAEVLMTVAAKPNFLGIDLGNEINCLDHDLPIDQGDDWGRRMVAELRRLKPGLEVVNGTDHNPWMCSTTFSPEHLSNDYSFATLHSWPGFSGSTERGPIDALPSLCLLAFHAQWARAFARDPLQAIWIQEFGACDDWGTVGQRQTWLTQAIKHALAEGVRRFTFWCSHDKIPSMQFHPWEYHYGLLTSDNREKPLAATWREAVGHARSLPTPLAAHDCAVVIPDRFIPGFDPRYTWKDWLERTMSSDYWIAYDAWLALARAGRTPLLTTPSRAGSLPVHCVEGLRGNTKN